MLIVLFHACSRAHSIQAKVLENYGIKVLVINQKTTQAAHAQNRTIWKEALGNVDVLILSPEQLEGRNFSQLLTHESFLARVWVIGVDEIHLLDSWGASFRESFRQIGFVLARMPPSTVLIGVTATLVAGAPFTRVINFLGLEHLPYHKIHRSNIRKNLRLITQTLSMGITGLRFPNLDWLLQLPGRPKTLIFVKTIPLGDKIRTYLANCSQGSEEEKIIRFRTYSSLSCEDDNAETQRLMHLEGNSSTQFIIATDALIVGVDFRNVKYCVVIDANQSLNDFMQKIGRIGCDPHQVPDAEGILLHTEHSLEVATKIAAAGPLTHRPDDKTQMDYAMAVFLLSSCKRKTQNDIYKNPQSDPSCGCMTCTALMPPSQPPDPRSAEFNMDVCEDSEPSSCTCCQLPDHHPARTTAVTTKKKRAKKAKFALTIAQAEHLNTRLCDFRLELYNEADDVTAYTVPPPMFFPEHVMKRIANHYELLKSPADVMQHIADVSLLAPHTARLFSYLQSLHPELQAVREAKRLQRSAANVSKAQETEVLKHRRHRRAKD